MMLTNREAFVGGSTLATAFGLMGEFVSRSAGLSGLTALVASSIAYGVARRKGNL